MGQKIESVHTYKRRCAELQVQLSRNDIYLKRLKDDLMEAEERNYKLQKVYIFVYYSYIA